MRDWDHYLVLNYFIQLWINLFSIELFYTNLNYFIQIWIILFKFELFYSPLNYFIQLWFFLFSFELFNSNLNCLFVTLSCGLVSAPLLNLLAHFPPTGWFIILVLFVCLYCWLIAAFLANLNFSEARGKKWSPFLSSWKTLTNRWSPP